MSSIEVAMNSAAVMVIKMNKLSTEEAETSLRLHDWIKMDAVNHAWSEQLLRAMKLYKKMHCMNVTRNVLNYLGNSVSTTYQD